MFGLTFLFFRILGLISSGHGSSLLVISVAYHTILPEVQSSAGTGRAMAFGASQPRPPPLTGFDVSRFLE
jgi:hypothetical protein